MNAGYWIQNTYCMNLMTFLQCEKVGSIPWFNLRTFSITWHHYMAPVSSWWGPTSTSWCRFPYFFVFIPKNEAVVFPQLSGYVQTSINQHVFEGQISICSCSDCFCSVNFGGSINLEVSFSRIETVVFPTTMLMKNIISRQSGSSKPRDRGHNKNSLKLPPRPYGWWTKPCTSWYGKFPIIYRVVYIPGGAGFLPPTVVLKTVSLFDSTQRLQLVRGLTRTILQETTTMNAAWGVAKKIAFWPFLIKLNTFFRANIDFKFKSTWILIVTTRKVGVCFSGFQIREPFLFLRVTPKAGSGFAYGSERRC